MLPYINLGPIGLPTAPLIYILGVWLALYAVDRAARRLGQAAEPVYALASLALLTGFIGARLLFVLLHALAAAALYVGTVRHVRRVSDV